MIADTSALLAILLGEPEADSFIQKILAAEECLVSAVSFVEVSIMTELSGGDGALRQLDALLRTGGIEVAPVDEDQALLARQAYSDFGKGRHPAGLTFGVCFS